MPDLDLTGSQTLPDWFAVTQRPDYARAARALAANMLQACEEDANLCTVFKDAGAYLTAMFAMYLHGNGDLTLSRLKEICAGSGFLSPGRARSLLQVLTHIGYLRPEGSSRSTVYRPTAAFISAWRRHLQLAMLAASILEPSLTRLCDHLDRHGVFEALLSVQARRLYQLAHGPVPSPGLRRAFLHPHAGSQILWTMVVAGDDEEDFPPRGSLAIPLGPMAARFRVTRVQVRRVLAGAEREGLLQYQGGGAAVLLEAGVQSLNFHLASQLVELLEAGGETLDSPAFQRCCEHF